MPLAEFGARVDRLIGHVKRRPRGSRSCSSRGSSSSAARPSAQGTASPWAISSAASSNGSRPSTGSGVSC